MEKPEKWILTISAIQLVSCSVLDRPLRSCIGSWLCDPTPISSPVGGLLDTINKSNLVFISFRLLKCDGDADKDFMSSFWAEHLITQGLILQRVFQQYISSAVVILEIERTSKTKYW